MILCSLAIHLTWGTLILLAPSVQHIAPLHILPFPSYLTSACLYMASAIALMGLCMRLPGWGRCLALLPQQILMYCAAIGASEAIWVGSHGGEHISPHLVILAEELPVILLAFFHNITIIRWGRMA